MARGPPEVCVPQYQRKVIVLRGMHEKAQGCAKYPTQTHKVVGSNLTAFVAHETSVRVFMLLLSSCVLLWKVFMMV